MLLPITNLLFATLNPNNTRTAHPSRPSGRKGIAKRHATLKN